FKCIAPHRSRNCRLRNRHSSMLRSPAVTKRRILIVHEDKDVRKNIAEILATPGFRIFEADSAERGLELARTQPIDSFLIHMDMPGTNGIELCRAIRETEPYKFTPVILCTDGGLHDGTVAAFASGC